MILVTGAAGFIGAHVLASLASQGRAAIGLDSFNDAYDVSLKHDRVNALVTPAGARVLRVNCADMPALQAVFRDQGVRQVVHLAAQAGVLQGMEQPAAYIESNITGFANVLECCRQARVDHLVYASSSSVYGTNAQLPCDEADAVTHPASLYAATKASNELLAHAYSHLFGLPTTGLRLFTVYGPWGRPDMAPFLFSRAMATGEPVRVFNHGNMRRDFVYIDDVVLAVCRTLDRPAAPDPDYDRRHPANGSSDSPWRIFNVGSQQAEALGDFIALLEKELGRRAIQVLEPMPAGDVAQTLAATQRLADWSGAAPVTPLATGIRRFADWYKAYYASLFPAGPHDEVATGRPTLDIGTAGQ